MNCPLICPGKVFNVPEITVLSSLFESVLVFQPSIHCVDYNAHNLTNVMSITSEVNELALNEHQNPEDHTQSHLW